MFSCKVCIEKNKRIEDLKVQITHLQKLIENMTNPTYSRAVDAEADKILNGANTFVEHLGKEDKDALSAVERQAISLLTANY